MKRLHSRIPSGGSLLVLGSGAGRECFALAQAGFRVRGVEFSPAMVELSNNEAAARGLDIEFLHSDIRELELEANSLDGILFTYDVYSFVPLRRVRVELDEKTLQEIAARTGGRYFHASSSKGLEAVYREIDELERTEITEIRYLQYSEHYDSWVAGALSCIGLSALFGSSVLRRFP